MRKLCCWSGCRYHVRIFIECIRLICTAGFRTNGESCGECTDDEDFLARNGLGKKDIIQSQ